ncbi:amidohydrolase family protein [Romboutsia timonensis]|uniref:amidohydrolase family protein n=1 Tax=Romboutsia timonensis TaxID=1776391 RepID=UPI0008D9C3E7|nr:amidohydrolase family protein [Romboutsia timonensis]
MITVVKNGRVIDPYNNIDSKLNIVIKDGKILELTPYEISGEKNIDATGLIVCPGFIDIHMHEDMYHNEEDYLDEWIAKSMLNMGVTTCIGGNCGINLTEPLTYLDAVDRLKLPVNIGLMAGHTNIRECVVENSDKYNPIQTDDIKKIMYTAREYLEGGCFGISYGIRYVPGITELELIEVSKACKPENKIINAHVRDDAKNIIWATKEFIKVGMKLDIPIQNSHIGSMGGYGQMKELLRLLDSVKSSGLDITSDCYPYYAFSTRIGETTYDDGFLERYNIDYDSIEISEGKYKGQRCTKNIFDELRKNSPDTITVGHVMNEKDIDMAILHPNVMIASDGFLHNEQGHPRAAGTFPRLIDKYVKTGKLSLYDAINKMTTMQAKKLGLSNKGNLSKGSDADITIFSYDEIKDNATFDNPIKKPDGIKYVLIKGSVALKDGEIVNGKLGTSVRR